MQDFLDALKSVVIESLPPAALLAFLGYMFREKWKQVLTKSLAVDLEKLKSDLAIEKAEHAASLTQQLENHKHELQRHLELMRVRGDVQKSTAIRYNDVKFDRLVKLEKDLSVAANQIGWSWNKHTMLGLPLDDPRISSEALESLRKSIAESEMFMTDAERASLWEYFHSLSRLFHDFDKQDVKIRMSSADSDILCGNPRMRVDSLMRGKIHELALPVGR